jgi:hypothetical protein
MASDWQYVDWLLAQDWFRDRYQGMFTLIVNNFTEPTETPEHNRLQMRFLDDALCAKLAASTGVARLTKIAKGIIERWPAEKSTMEGKLAEARATLDRIPERPSVYRGFEAQRAADTINDTERRLKEGEEKASEAAQFIKSPSIDETKLLRRNFENRGWDVVFEVEWITPVATAGDLFKVEIKPSLGDDFPAVLRQMKVRRTEYEHGERMLIIDVFTAVGATFEQVKAVFAADGFPVVTFNEITS